ncbi:MAG: type IV pilin protein, partial [Candidatus Fervidibacter sp.]|uniref:type IV pilin protein n=1 Tax=Candidatus Fervidibacter sp. TaxID=3100871 RepID=UPI00404944C4
MVKGLAIGSSFKVFPPRRGRDHGFTLIELLVVIAIIAILKVVLGQDVIAEEASA